MTDIPHAALSEHFQQRMQGRQLVSAIFTTFKFDPAFFETEVLPVFFDVGLSHVTAVRLLQLEDILKAHNGSIAVYYDRHGLVPDAGAPKLDVRRVPISHPTGIFHSKNVIALVEKAEPDASGARARAVLCACLSANLTRAGWWENVEVAHVEEVAEDEHTNLRDSLLSYLDRLVRAAEGQRPNDEIRREHPAVRDIRQFLQGTTQRDRRSIDGRLRTHFHDGDASLPDFIEGIADTALRGMCLEIISPYFDGGGESAPLRELIERFSPREVRVFLPRNERAEGECAEQLFSWLRAQPGVSWGALPNDLLRLGKGEEVKRRTVHAKVYRFFEPVRGGREILYVGSTNLTQPGCRIAGRGGNWETGFLVEVTGSRPDWWMTTDTKKPPAFAPKGEDEGIASSGGTRLLVRYRWERREASVCWTGSTTSAALTIQHGGVAIVELHDLSPREWVALDADSSARFEKSLVSTSIFHIVGEGPEPALLLVQEEEMHARPSLLHELSAADILRYWALLTVEQRAAFIEARVKIAGDDDPLVAKLAPLPFETTMFDRFAGVFHAFECLEQRVKEALEHGNTREADYRLFGKKYDSLGNLLERVAGEVNAGKGDRVEQYVVTLCARQLLRGVGRAHPEYWAEHRDAVRALEATLAGTANIRASLADSHPEMPAFLDWFEKWFLRRAEALPEEDEA
jgi:hypothetical protein